MSKPVPPEAQPWYFRLFPAVDSLRNYDGKTFGHDLIAGLTVAAVAIPQAMAYAQIVPLPAQYGLYTAIVMTAVGAIFDSSKQLINGPTNAISIALYSALLGFTNPDERIAAAILMAFLVGSVQLGITLLRLGDLTRYISHAVVVGFTLGAAVLLACDQFKNLLGLSNIDAKFIFLKRFWLTLTRIPETNPTAFLLGVSSILLAIGLKWINQRLKFRVPELLLTVIATAWATWYWQLDKQGVQVVGNFSGELPRMKLPELRWDWILNLAGNSLAIGTLGLLEAIAMAKAIASQTRQKLDINQQCLSEAVANITGSLFQCMPGSGSLTRSNINQQTGGCTQWSGVISALAVALTMLLFAPYASYIPKSALAGILMVSAWRLVGWKELKHYLRTTTFDARIVWMTAVSALFSIEFCVLIGVLMSFVMFVSRAARVHCTELVVTPGRQIRERISTDPPCNRMRIFSLEGELFFGAAPELEEHLEKVAATAQEGVRVVVLRLKRVRNPDTVCLGVLGQFADDMRAANVTVVLCGVRPDLMRVLVSSGLVKRLGSDHVFVFEETGGIWTSTLEAVRFAYQHLGTTVCDHCPHKATDLGPQEGWHYVI